MEQTESTKEGFKNFLHSNVKDTVFRDRYKYDEESAPAAFATSIKENIVDSGILLIGCQTRISEEAYGVFRYAIHAIIAGKDVVTNRKKLHRQGKTQMPRIYCSDYNVDAPFMIVIQLMFVCKYYYEFETISVTKKKYVLYLLL
ncbi:ICE-like protease (caspase) p20 domain protein [Medicago truncatula]|uniref:ICE-like protease (Caspase) p20 domain protein n=1 Tax=Medicago truncatula TaxID=3880 RepID=A0A072V833_MEDTR|nr:ICE-like protease (caspase) p20 domain protein [Medicago truncatula]